jgi:hypothetical protein
MNARKAKAAGSMADVDGGAIDRTPGMSTDSVAESGELDRHSRIAGRAYPLAMERGFEAGREVDDWLRAERELDLDNGPRLNCRARLIVR